MQYIVKRIAMGPCSLQYSMMRVKPPTPTNTKAPYVSTRPGLEDVPGFFYPITRGPPVSRWTTQCKAVKKVARIKPAGPILTPFNGWKISPCHILTMSHSYASALSNSLFFCFYPLGRHILYNRLVCVSVN